MSQNPPQQFRFQGNQTGVTTLTPAQLAEIQKQAGYQPQPNTNTVYIVRQHELVPGQTVQPVPQPVPHMVPQPVPTTIPTPKAEIPGTKLKTGTWYTITVKSGAAFTWAHQKIENYNHIKLVWKGGESDDYLKLTEFFKQDNHWKLEQSEDCSYFVLVNRTHPNSPLTVTGSSLHGKYVVICLDKTSAADYLPGGRFRAESLWKFEAEEGHGENGNYYVFNKKCTGNGILSWTGKGPAAGQNYAQVYDEGQKADYGKKDKNYTWTFAEVSE